MIQNKILVIDDDKDLCVLLKRELRQENYAVTVCHDGAAAVEALYHDKYQLVVLDIMLPVLNGFDVLEHIRKDSTVPVLMLTARASEADKVSGLRLGADDYLTKPFLLSEFMARVHSLIRRYTVFSSADTPAPLTFTGLELNPALRSVTADNREVYLTAKEFDLLYFLASNPMKVYTKEQIYNHVWQDEYAFDDRNIMSFISKLRKKIRNDTLQQSYIQTIHGIGYRFNPEV